MGATTIEFRRLTRGVTNPQRDRRFKYGTEAVPYFKHGLGLTLLTYEHSTDPTRSYRVLRLATGPHFRDTEPVFDLLLAASAPSVPITFAEAILVTGDSPDPWIIEDTINRMVDDGLIDLKAVIDTRWTMNKEYEKEEA